MNPIPKLVCSKNDLEAKFILELCEKRQKEIEFLDLALDWGETPDFSSEPIKSLLYPEEPGHILLVEIPSLELEERLRAAGHRLVVIDHHSILSPGNGLIKRFSRKSSVEQIVDYMGWKLGPDEDKRMREVAANDTGSWFGLMKHFAELPVDRALEQSGRVREEEQEVRKEIASKNTNGKDKGSESPAATSQNKPTPVIPVTRKLETGLGGGRGTPFYFKTCAIGALEETAEEFQRALAMELHESSISGSTFAYEKYNENIDKEIANGKKPRSKKTKDDLEKEILVARRSIDPPEILYLEIKPGKTEHQPDTIKGLFFTCGKAGVAIIRDILETKAASSPADLTIVTGGNHERGYLYAFGDEGELSSLADLILDNCLHGVKPLLAWQTTFIQAITVPGSVWMDVDGMIPIRWVRHSIRQKGNGIPMEGFLGTLVLNGDLDAVIPSLHLCELFGAGSHAALGLGTYELSVL